MIAVPAVDLKGGRCVQLVGGRPEEERISLPDPAAVAERWWSLGFGMLHVIDLDAALGAGDKAMRDRVAAYVGVTADELDSGRNTSEANSALVAKVVRATPAVTQVGGGLRDEAAVDRAFAAGADRVIVGTRAVDDPEWLSALSRDLPGRVLLAADVRGEQVLRKGWREASAFSLFDLLDRVADLPLAGVLCTDVAREGRMQGIDRDSAARTVRASGHPLWISGGVTSMDDLEALEAAGAAGVVLGMALYTDKLPAEEVAARWGALPTAAPSASRIAAGRRTP